MRRWQDNERAQRMNDVFRERAYLNGVRYIDAYASFIDESGGYSDYGPDITGKVAACATPTASTLPTAAI